jgi:DNA-binding transcriptional ArsR family regulator
MRFLKSATVLCRQEPGILLTLYITDRLYIFTVIDKSGGLDRTFAALADPTRRAILARLASGEATVTELMKPFALSQPAISKHLRVLEQAGLISQGRDAQRRPRRLEAGPLAEANEWLERYRQIWEGSFERLDDLLTELSTQPPKQLRKKRNNSR